tara:strand:+ start:896 stop:1819 length:924 start_codon:yes stop_codon:yes gene_type:complete
MSNLTDFFSSSGGGGSNLSSDVFADIVIVGGGGGGAQSTSSSCMPNCPSCGCYRWGGGGGGGIYRVRYGLTCDQTYPITVGAGGAGSPTDAGIEGLTQGENGSPSKFDGNRFIALGGGGAGSVKRTVCPTQCPSTCRGRATYGRAGGQGGSGVGWCFSTFDAPGSSFGSQYGYHYGSAMFIFRGQAGCPVPCGFPNDATKPVNGYDLSGSSACDTFARPGWLCETRYQCPTGPAHPQCCCNWSAGQANSGDGAGNCNGSATGGSGFVVVSYPDSHRAAPARPGSNDCSACTPGYRTYVFTSSGSITL